MPAKPAKAKRPPCDPNELAKYIVDVSIGKAEKIEPPKKKALLRLSPVKSAVERAARLAHKTLGT